MGGEWWYSTIKPKLFIEEEISDDGENPKEYHFRCIEGKVVGITMSQRDAAGKENFDTAYNPDFSWNPGLKVIRSLPNIYNETPKNSESMLQIAGAIGKQFEFVRIDLYSPRPDSVILGELTLCPGAGLGKIDPNSMDELWGKNWDMAQYFL